MRIFFILFITTTSLFSQSVIGFKIAGNHTSLNFIERYQEKGGIQGINAGLIYKYYNEPHLAVQVELNYSQRGGKEKSADSTFIRKYNYIEVPFMTHIHFGGDRAEFFINLGPNFGYNLSGTDYSKIDSVKLKSKHKYSVNENRFDFGIVVGGGLMLNTGIGEFQIEPRFQYSLSNINKNEDIQIHSNYIILSLSAAYLIKWEKVFK